MEYSYFITTVNEFCTDSRCVGFYDNMPRAVFAISNNLMDIHEDFWPYCVIEEYEGWGGLYPTVTKEKWFRWDGGKYEECDKPDQFSYITNISLG